MCTFHVDDSDCYAWHEKLCGRRDGGERRCIRLQDENSQRLDSVTAMDEDGSIYEVGESDGTVDEGTAEESIEEDGGIALFSARSARSVSTKVVNFNTKANATTEFSYSGGDGYTNGNYGADAAYLGTDGSGNIKFMLARGDRNG